MQYRLRTLLAVSEFHRDVGLVLVSLAVIAVGAFFVLTPAQHLLKSDRKTAHWLYEREIKRSGDQTRAIAAAALFYRLLGYVLVTFGLAILVFACIPSPSN